MSYSLNSSKGVIQGTIIGVIKGDTRSVDYSSYTYPSFLYLGPRLFRNPGQVLLEQHVQARAEWSQKGPGPRFRILGLGFRSRDLGF